MEDMRYTRYKTTVRSTERVALSVFSWYRQSPAPRRASIVLGAISPRCVPFVTANGTQGVYTNTNKLHRQREVNTPKCVTFCERTKNKKDHLHSDKCANEFNT